MATMYENLCGNCVGGVELTFFCMTFHMHAFNFFHTIVPLHIDLTIFKIQLYSTYRVAT
jgi:hypothetical protein